MCLLLRVTDVFRKPEIRRCLADFPDSGDTGLACVWAVPSRLAWRDVAYLVSFHEIATRWKHYVLSRRSFAIARHS
jgi:hypothetical protein